MWGAIGNTWERQKSKTSNMPPYHPPQKEKNLVYWCHSSLGRSSFPMAILAIAYIFSSPILARLMTRACLWEHSFIFLSSTRPLHPFSLYIWGVHLYWWLVFFCQCGLDIEICKHPILPHQTLCPKWQMCFQHQSLWLAYVASPLEKGRKVTSLISKHIYHFE